MTLSTLVLCVLAATLPAQSTRMARDPLATHRWTHRLLVIDVPDTAAGRTAVETFRAALDAQMDEVRDRDLRIVQVGDLPGAAETLQPSIALDASERLTVRRRLRLEGREPQLVLIGKDGGEKARQSGVFDLPQLLALIDTMPMRRAETPRR